MRALLLLLTLAASAAPLPRLKVCDNHRFLCTADGKPFFYLADTAWELFHRLDRKEAIEYLDTRAAQGFTAIQAVALAELDGVTDPNAYGKLPLVNKDPDPARARILGARRLHRRPGEARGLYIAMLPSWGRWVNNTGRTDESLLTPSNAQTYGEFLGKRYGRKRRHLDPRRRPHCHRIRGHLARSGSRHRDRGRRERGLRRRPDELPSARRRDLLHLVPRRPVARLQHAPDRATGSRRRSKAGSGSRRITTALPSSR